MLHYLQRGRATTINLNCRCHMFSVVANSNTINAELCRIKQTEKLPCKWQFCLILACEVTERIQKISWIDTVLFINVIFKMFSPSEKPTVLANLHHVYTDFSLKCVSHYFLLQVSYVFLVFAKLTKHHSILEPVWKSLTKLKIILLLCFQNTNTYSDKQKSKRQKLHGRRTEVEQILSNQE